MGAATNNRLASDAYGYSLGYYESDYKAIGNDPAFGNTYQSQAGDITEQSLFNGHISNATVALSSLNGGDPVGYTYRYDQLNRLKTMRQHTGIYLHQHGGYRRQLINIMKPTFMTETATYKARTGTEIRRAILKWIGWPMDIT